MSDFIFSVNVTFPIFLVLLQRQVLRLSWNWHMASTARTGFFPFSQRYCIKSPHSVVFPTPPFPATAITCAINISSCYLFLKLYQCTQAGTVDDLRNIFPFVQCIQMDALNAQCTVCIDLFDRVFDTFFFEFCNFLVVE